MGLDDLDQEPNGWERWEFVLRLMAGLMALFSVAGAINTATGNSWRVRISGSSVDLPKHWEVVIPLMVITAILFGLSLLFGNLYTIWGFAKRRPLRSLSASGLVVGAAASVYLFWGRYALAGGKLYWAIENDRLDVLEAVLADQPESARLDAAHEALHEGRPEMFRRLLASGIPRDPERDPHRRCFLSSAISGGAGAVEAAVESGATVAACSEGSEMLTRLLRYSSLFHYTAPDVIKAARLLVQAGADPHWQGDEGESALVVAQRKHMDELVALFDTLPKPATAEVNPEPVRAEMP